MKCKWCALDFVPGRPNQLFCSPSCKSSYKWSRKSPEKKKEYWRRSGKKRKPTRILANKQIILEYRLNHPCACGETDPICLDFHHRDGEVKKFGISRIKNKYVGQAALLAEIAKCDVLCANCHRKHHAKERIERKHLTVKPSSAIL